MNNYNNILDYKDVTEESLIPDEPVTVQEVKDYLRLEGFVDVDESTTESLSDFNYDDSLISDMIIAARRKAENFCGCSFVFHTWKVLLTNCAGDIELPFGPMRNFVSLHDKNENVISGGDVKIRGFNFTFIERPKNENMVAIYDAGYEDCPEEVVLAIKQTVAYWYENRVAGSIPELALATLRPFKRSWTYIT